jgi:hypothetical protein
MAKYKKLFKANNLSCGGGGDGGGGGGVKSGLREKIRSDANTHRC